MKRLSAVLLTVGLAVFGVAGPALADSGSGGENITVRVLGPGTVSCSDDHGQHLGETPHLHHEQRCHLHVTGFAPHQRVHLTLHSAPRNLGDVTAASDGHVDYTFTVPADLSSGPHTLMFVAHNPAVAVEFAFIVDVPAGQQNGNGSTGSSQISHSGNNGGSGGQSGNGGNGGLAHTGEPIVQLLELAMVLVGVGAVTLAAGRRRRPDGPRQVAS